MRSSPYNARLIFCIRNKYRHAKADFCTVAQIRALEIVELYFKCAWVHWEQVKQKYLMM